MKKLDEVKTFVKDNKKRIIIGAIGAGLVVTGRVAGKRVKYDEIRIAIKNLKTFNPNSNGSSIFKNLNIAMNGSNYAAVPGGGSNQTLASTFDAMINFYKNNGFDLDTEVTGAVFFLNTK